MEERYRRLFKLSDKDFEKAVVELTPEKLDIQVIQSFSGFHNPEYLKKVHSILSFHFPLLVFPKIDFAIIASLDQVEQREARERLMKYAKEHFDFQELLILKNFNSTDVMDAAHLLVLKHFSQEWEREGKVGQVVAMF